MSNADAPVVVRRRTRSRARIGTVLTILLAGMALFVWSFWFEPARMIEHRHALTLPHWPQSCDGLRVDLVSDIHTGSWRNGTDNLDRLVQRLSVSDADAVMLAGDYMVLSVPLSDFIGAETIAKHLQPLATRKPVYAVLGNHDWWKDGPRTSRAFAAAGIRMIDNEALPVKLRGCEFWLAGLGDYLEGAPDVEGTYAAIPSGAPVIALTHEPALFPQIPAQTAITLAGHTHGGQIDPWPFRRENAGYVHGSSRLKWHVQQRGRHMFVTPGIGTSILPMRLGATPEISQLQLRSLPLSTSMSQPATGPSGDIIMSTLAIALIVLVALLHLYFMVLEMFLWTKPLGLKVFRNTPEKAEITRVLAANQGLYNGFLAAGLLWAAYTDRSDAALFFLGCVVVAGLYGAYSVNKRIFFVQALPALVAIVAVLFLKG